MDDDRGSVGRCALSRGARPLRVGRAGSPRCGRLHGLADRPPALVSASAYTSSGSSRRSSSARHSASSRRPQADPANRLARLAQRCHSAVGPHQVDGAAAPVQPHADQTGAGRARGRPPHRTASGAPATRPAGPWTAESHAPATPLPSQARTAAGRVPRPAGHARGDAGPGQVGVARLRSSSHGAASPSRGSRVCAASVIRRCAICPIADAGDVPGSVWATRQPPGSRAAAAAS